MRTHTDGQQAIPTTTDRDTFPADYAHRWTMVKSVPEDPHEYVVRRNLDPGGKAAYDRFVAFIRQHGEKRQWRWKATSRPKNYWYLQQDGYEFWEAPEGLVNRKPIGQRRKVATCPECGTVGVDTEKGLALPHPDCGFLGAAILSDPT